MQVLRYHSTTNHTSSTRLCEYGKPIIFQVFFSDFEDGQLMDDVWDYEPWYFDFDFADNGYGKHLAALKEEAEEKERLDEIYHATLVDTRSIPEIEKALVSQIPIKPDRNWYSSYIYDHCAKGNEHFHLGEYSKAVAEYEVALALNSYANDVKLSLALAYYFLGDYFNARRVIDSYQVENRSYYDADPTPNINQFYHLLQLKIAS